MTFLLIHGGWTHISNSQVNTGDNCRQNFIAKWDTLFWFIIWRHFYLTWKHSHGALHLLILSLKLTRWRSHFTITLVVTSHGSNTCSVFASQACLCATHVREKALLSCDVTTKVLVKWGLHKSVNFKIRCDVTLYTAISYWNLLVWTFSIM